MHEFEPQFNPKMSTFVPSIWQRLTHLAGSQLECEGLVAVEAAKNRERDRERDMRSVLGKLLDAC